MNAAHDAGDIFALPISLALRRRTWVEVLVREIVDGFRVADIIERDAIHIVILHNLLADAGNVVCRFGLARNHEHLASLGGLHQFRTLSCEGGCTVFCLSFLGADGDAHHPCMQFHATLVTLIDAEGQWVITWVFPCHSRETQFPRFNLGRVEEGCAHSCLKDDGVDVGTLILVENADEFLLLSLTASGIDGLDARPVESSDGGEPDSTRFA